VCARWPRSDGGVSARELASQAAARLSQALSQGVPSVAGFAAGLAAAFVPDLAVL
jgi:hypothetical protein